MEIPDLMRIARFTICALTASVALVQTLAATPIYYVESGQITGTLGSTTLTDTSFTFTFYADTANITVSSGPFWLNMSTFNNFDIGGNNGSFTSTIYVEANNPSSGVGMCIPSGGTCSNDTVSFVGTGAGSYALATAVSIPQASGPYGAGTFATTAGTLTVTGAQNLTFTATLGTPEPETIGNAVPDCSPLPSCANETGTKGIILEELNGDGRFHPVLSHSADLFGAAPETGSRPLVPRACHASTFTVEPQHRIQSSEVTQNPKFGDLLALKTKKRNKACLMVFSRG